jgi:hypothetical protein
MRDDQILPGGSGALQNVQCGHHCHCYSGNRSVRIAGLKCIHRLRVPRHSNTLLDPLDDLPRGYSLRLRRDYSATQQREMPNAHKSHKIASEHVCPSSPYSACHITARLRKDRFVLGVVFETEVGHKR